MRQAGTATTPLKWRRTTRALSRAQLHGPRARSASGLPSSVLAQGRDGQRPDDLAQHVRRPASTLHAQAVSEHWARQDLDVVGQNEDPAVETHRSLDRTLELDPAAHAR